MTTNERPAMPGQSSHVRLLRLREVLSRVGYSRSEWYRKTTNGTAPAPVKLGEHASAWVSSEIDAFIADRIAARDALTLSAKLLDALRPRGKSP